MSLEADSPEGAAMEAERRGAVVEEVVLEDEYRERERKRIEDFQAKYSAPAPLTPVERKRRLAEITSLVFIMPVIPALIMVSITKLDPRWVAALLSCVGLTLLGVGARQYYHYEVVTADLPDTGPGSPPYGIRQGMSAALVFGFLALLLAGLQIWELVKG
jgi:hypothetical protein